MTLQQEFRAAHIAGMAASPFATDSALPLILITPAGRQSLLGCVIEVGDNSAAVEEFGMELMHTLSAQIPKSILPTAPHVTRDAVEHNGRRYNLQSVTGGESASPVWIIDATSPLKP